MSLRELTDDEVFGTQELSDADVFGVPEKKPRRDTMRAVAPSDDERARRDFAQADPRRVDAPKPAGGSVLDTPRPAGSQADPMLRPEFIQRVRDTFANVPEADRLPALRNLARDGTDVWGRAARVLLPEVEAENARGLRQEQDSPAIAGALARAGKVPPMIGQGGAQARTAFPDAAPTFGETMDGTQQADVLAMRGAGRTMAAADTSVEAIADRAERGARDFEAEAFAKENPVIAATASGGGRMVAGLLNSVPTIMDFAARLVDKDISRAPNAPGVDDISRTVDSLMPKIGRQGMDEAWNRDEFGGWLVTNLAAQAPQVAGSVLAAFIPALRPALLPMMGAQAAGNSFQQGDQSLSAVLKGGVEVASEMIPLKAFDRARDALAKLPPRVRGEALAALGSRMAVVGGAVTAQGVVGAIEEVVAQIGQNGVDKFVEGKKTGLMDQVADAAVLGAFASGAMSIPQGAGALARSREMSVEESLITAPETGQTRKAAPLVIRADQMPTTPFTPEQVTQMVQAAAIDRAAGVLAPGMPVQPAPAAQPAPTGLADEDIGVASVPQGALAALAEQQLEARSGQPDLPAPPVVAVPAVDVTSDQPGGSVGALGRVADAGRAGQVRAAVPEAAVGNDANAPVGGREPDNAALTEAPAVATPVPAPAPSPKAQAILDGLKAKKEPPVVVADDYGNTVTEASKAAPVTAPNAAAPEVQPPAQAAGDRVAAAPAPAVSREDVTYAVYAVTERPASDGIEPLSFEDADFELEALQDRAARGKLSAGALAQSEFGKRIDTNAMMALNAGLKADPAGTLQALRDAIAAKKAKAAPSQPPQAQAGTPAPAAPVDWKARMDAAMKADGAVAPAEDTSAAGKAKTLRKQADALQDEARKMLEGIPAGQPVRSTRDANLREKAREKSRKSIDLLRQADELEAVAAPAAPPAAEPTPAKVPPSFAAKHKVTTMAWHEADNKLAPSEMDAKSAMTALDEDITEMRAFIACLKG